MKQPILIQLHQTLCRLHKRTQIATGGDLELQAHWAKYLCVLVAGFLETALREIYKDFVRRNSSELVASYTNHELEKIQNPKSIRFVETASFFKKSWGSELQAFIEKNNRKEAIDSVMTNRHSIAHGRASHVTVSQVKIWLDKATEVVEHIEKQALK